MKKLIVVLAALSVSAAAQAALTSTQIYLTKDTASSVGITYKAQTLETFCRGLAMAVNFGSFEVATDVDHMANGFYSCQGQFVTQPNRVFEIFKIDSCTVQDPSELKCP